MQYSLEHLFHSDHMANIALVAIVVSRSRLLLSDCANFERAEQKSNKSARLFAAEPHAYVLHTYSIRWGD